jgi:hypothetical protein
MRAVEFNQRVAQHIVLRISAMLGGHSALGTFSDPK